ncbi:MAG: hypothetical protein KatS3mg068_1517 [Candidatus Sericytochromatia bacterium]|nr:MAG: hypothetical protein KatS3mg068_1517 [Candidatus Sericytochromatia bacterium]
MIYLNNAFSLNMLKDLGVGGKYLIEVENISKDQVKELLENNEFESVIGHEGTAIFLSRLLDLEVKYNRKPIILNEFDILIVLQLKTRLPEGKELTDDDLKNIDFCFYKVVIK